MSEGWTVADARQTWAIPHWGEGYFDVSAGGDMVVQPRLDDGPAVQLSEVVEAATAQGMRLPLLVRFSDILHDRRRRLQDAFARAMDELEYTGGYSVIYPIKVNQQRGVAGELADRGGSGFGLEAGSKPELLAALALAQPGSIVICNGYKDREYIRLALTGRKLGVNVFIVIEKPSELRLVIEESQNLQVEPALGVRMRLATLGAGKWQNTGGAKGKFGLTPRQLLTLVDQLRDAGLVDALKLLHFHMGSQMSNVRDIAAGTREAVRYFVELSQLGLDIRYMDVGGGLGVDYEGTRSRSECSINYGLDQYALTIVQAMADAVHEHDLPAPHILTESGRALTAHHAVLVVNVSDVETAPGGRVPEQDEDEPAVLRHLRQTHDELDQRPALELFHEAQFRHAEGLSLFALGQLPLRARARLDDLYYAIAHGVRARLKASERAQREALDELDQKLVDKYFVNFSVFESIPDVWAIDQVFPIVPVSGLQHAPDRRGVIADLTCDSDGRIDHYVDGDGVDVSMPLHSLVDGQSYRLGIFMVGAYQESLGDIHNLFGDTDAVNVRLDDAGGYTLANFRHGDTADLMLEYVGYDLAALRRSYAEKLKANGIDPQEAARLQTILEDGLAGYTYLAECP